MASSKNQKLLLIFIPERHDHAMSFIRTNGFKIKCGYTFIFIAIMLDTLVSHKLFRRIHHTRQQVNKVPGPTFIHKTMNDLRSWGNPGRIPDDPLPGRGRSRLVEGDPGCLRIVPLGLIEEIHHSGNQITDQNGNLNLSIHRAKSFWAGFIQCCGILAHCPPLFL